MKVNLVLGGFLMVCSMGAFGQSCNDTNCGCVDSVSRQVPTDKGAGYVQSNVQMRQSEETALSANESSENTHGSCSTSTGYVQTCADYCNSQRAESKGHTDINAALSSQCNNATSSPCPSDMENAVNAATCTDGEYTCYERYIYFDKTTKTRAYCYKPMSSWNDSACD